MINIAANLADLKRQLTEVLHSANFEIERIGFDQQTDWIIQNGTMSHRSGGYFHVIGVQNEQTKEEHIFFFQPQSAITGILLHVENGIIYVLVQARIEPGNTGIIQLGPTIQSTPANFLRAHGGKGTPYLDYFYSAKENVIGFNSSNQIDIGRLFYQKNKLLNYALVDRFIETEESFVWTPLSVLEEAAQEDYMVNTDLRSLLGVYDWNSLLGFTFQDEFKPAPILSYYLTKRATVKCTDRFIPIDNAKSICTTSNSIYTKTEAGSEIALYAIRTKHREVSEWVQPLWKGREKGKVLLWCRYWDSEEETEFLLKVKYERGVAGYYNICPTELVYPNEKDNYPGRWELGKVKHEFQQSDEGGRFIDHEYVFRIAEVDQNIAVDADQFWVGVQELKNILSMHNVASIQLRNICSAMMRKLNPHAFT